MPRAILALIACALVACAQPEVATATEFTRPAIVGIADGRELVLQPLDGEADAAAARRWARDAGFLADPDLDAVLRLLVQRLRAAEGAVDGLPRSTADGRRTLARVVVRHRGAPTVEGGEGVLGEPFYARLLEGESVEEAARGFLERMGLPLDPRDVEDLAASLAEHIEGVATTGGGAGAGGGSDAAPPPPQVAEVEVEATSPPLPPRRMPQLPPPTLPAREGVVLRVTFSDDEDKPDAFVVYRYGDSLPAVVSSFLDGAGVRDLKARSDATASITQALIDQAGEALRGGGSIVGTGAMGGEPLADVYTPSAVALPVAVGAHSFDVALPAGASLRAASRLFCEEHWAVMRPAMEAAVGALYSGLGEGGSAASRATVSQATCRAVVFDTLSAWVTK